MTRAASRRSAWTAATSVSSSLAASSGCGVSTVAWPRPARACNWRCKAGSAASCVQCIGVEHQPRASRQQRRQRLAHRRAAAAAADHGAACQHRRIAAPPCGPEHQLGLLRVMAGGVGIQQADEHAAGTRGQCGARRQQRGPGHARRPADHGKIAEAALVAGMAPRCQGHAQIVGACQARAGWQRARGHPQVVEPDLSGMVAPVGGEQTRLERQQRHRVGGPHRKSAQLLSGIGVQARGQVHREHRGGHLQQPVDGRGDRALRRA